MTSLKLDDGKMISPFEMDVDMKFNFIFIKCLKFNVNEVKLFDALIMYYYIYTYKSCDKYSRIDEYYWHDLYIIIAVESNIQVSELIL